MKGNYMHITMNKQYLAQGVPCFVFAGSFRNCFNCAVLTWGVLLCLCNEIVK